MIKLLTDSTADFTQDEARELGIAVVPLTVNFGDTHYADGIDMSLPEFYSRLATTQKLPTTSQPSPDAFLEHFDKAKENGDTLVCILISSHLSGTYQSAQIAKEVCDYDNIYIIDSLMVTLGLQILVRFSYRLLNEGKEAKEIVNALEYAKQKVRLFAIVDDLKYLRRGGRLSGAAAVAGGLLGIKPVVQVSEGKVGIAGKARGMPGAYTTIFKLCEQSGGIDSHMPFAVGYTGERHGVEPFVRYTTQNLHLDKPLIAPIGTVIGTHAGPGALGIAYFCK